MDRIRSDLKESISNNFLSTVHEEHDAILNASQGCKDFGKAVATTSTAYLGSMNKRTGFGHLDEDFWLGNDNIHAITLTETYELRVDLRYKGKSVFAQYSQFSVSDEMSKYTLRLGIYSGTAGNSLDYHNNCGFSTFDRDFDNDHLNCAEENKGGWWFNKCDVANLIGN
ncbi:hypothetical protein RRG08_041102 [Elysia crispata]|uniref:Fibrinogen C-terminal domain-containing protein n=1 Tax=Elysia crispata TaxID=231223 RepID=A0AAE0YPE4_9GAST|nr:hypothetical protein RRG08_041102 [Elysia crispata]